VFVHNHFHRIILFLWTIILFTSFLTPALAQPVPLGTPLLATASAELDRIVLFDLAGGRRELRFDARLHYPWGFSPDGCRMIFTLGERGGVSRLYSARLDGSDLRSLVQFADLPDDDWSAWEPTVNPLDGRIAFTWSRRERPPGDDPIETTHIAWIAAEGGIPQLYSVTGDEHTPLWSPSGNWLAYVSFNGRILGPEIYATFPPTQEAVGTPVPEEDLVNEADLWVVSADATLKYRLTAFPVGSVSMPRWSPDSTLLSFVYSPIFANDTYWIIGNADAAVPTQLTFTWALAVDSVWQPDGSNFLAAIRDFRGVTENRLWRMPLVGNGDSDSVEYPLDPALNYIDYPRFSADGRYLALRSEYRLVIIDTTTNTPRLLDESLPSNVPPVWSPAAYAGESGCDGG
jgi:Tol biopolymer transport system component